MADNKQFTLVGQFKDGITPELRKLTTQLSALTKSFEKMSGKLRPISKELGIMAGSSRTMADALKMQRGAYEQNVRAMKTYRSEVGKIVSSQRQLQRRVALPSVQPPPTPRAPGGTRGGPRFYDAPGSGGNAVADFVAGGLITSAIVKGFEIGTQIMERSLRYVMGTFSERVTDQIEDIAGAGGIFAGAKSANLTAFGATMDDAMDVQKELNRSMATLAADLPGTTNDFVRNARSITDTMMTAISKQPDQFVAAMEKMSGKTNLGQKGALITAATSVSQSTTLLEKLSPGGGMPMTMLFEDLMARDTVDAKQMQRKYASMRRNPTLIAALERNQKEINKYAAGSAERLVAISKALNEAVPPEMINMMKRSVSGVIEGFKSNFLDPDTGMFGLSRQMGFMVKQFDTTTGKVRLDKAGKEVKEAVGIFEMISDIIGNLGVVLNSSVVPALLNIVFPFDQLGKTLVNLREKTYRYFEHLQNSTRWFGEVAKKYGMDASSFQAGTRGGLTTLAAIFESMGEISTGKYASIVKKLEQKDPKVIKEVGNELLEIFKSSKFLDMITEAAGKIFGGLLDAIADMMDMVASGTEKFAAKGFGKGFNEAGGYDAITRIFTNVFKLLWKGFVEAVKLWFASMGTNLKTGNLGALAAQIGLTALITRPLHGFLGMLFRTVFSKKVAQEAAEGGGGLFKGLFSKVPGFVAQQGDTAAKAGSQLPGVAKAAKLASGAKMKGIGLIASAMVTFATHAPQLAKAGKAVTALGKRIPLLSVAFAGLDFAAQKAEGKSTLQAGASAGGSLVGGIAGAAIGQALIPIPGVGAVAGGTIGSFLGSWIGEQLANIGPAIMSGASSFQSWIKTLPETFGGWLGQTASRVQNWFSTEAPLLVTRIQGWFNNLGAKMREGFSKFVSDAGKALSDPSQWGSLAKKLLEAIKTALMNTPIGLAIRGGMGVADFLARTGEAAKTGYAVQQTQNTKPTKGQTKFVDGVGTMRWNGSAWVKAAAKGSAHPFYGNLGSAVNYEMKNKPAGSDLVIANSSETIIPAAGGFDAAGGIKGMIDAIWRSSAEVASTMATGFSTLTNTIKTTQQQHMAVTRTTSNATQAAIRQSILVSQQGDRQILTAIKAAAAAGGMFGPGGGELGGGKGNLGAASALAKSMGLMTTSGFRPGDPGYHGLNRARDFSNSTGPTPQMMAFAQKMAAQYGSSMTELIYTPLGYSIKHGKKVPPIAANSHYNHVHVAFAKGLGSGGTFFPTASEALAYEKMMVPGSVKVGQVASVTGNSTESLGGTYNVTNNITIQQTAGQDAEELASIVALKISMAVNELRSASYYV